MWNIETTYKLKLGGSYFIDCGTLVQYRDTPLFNVRRRESDGLVGVDFDLYNSEGAKIATIRHGNIVSGDAKAYDISLGAHHYTIKERESGRTVCDLRRKDATESGTELELAVDLYTSDKFHFIASPEMIILGGNMFRGMTIEKCKVGIMIG